MVKLLWGAIICAMAVGSPAAAQFRLNVDASQPAAVMEALQGGDASPEIIDRLLAMPGTISGIEHHKQFTTSISPEDWRASLAEAIAGRPRNDPYRFNTLIQNRDAVLASIDYVVTDPPRFAAEVYEIIAPYTPRDILFDANVVFVVGSSGNGWVRREGEFFFDIGNAQGDIEGTRVIAAHELYHLVLARIMLPADLDPADPLGRVQRMLRQGLNEGMASHVGRFKADTGALSRRNLGFERQNLQRQASNFKLMETFLLATANYAEVAPRDAGLIVFSGTYTEPGYFVFREMAAEIENRLGRDQLMALVSGPPSRFILTYHEVADPSLPRFTEPTLAIIRALDERVSVRP